MFGFAQRHIYQAVGAGLLTFLTLLMGYDAPPDRSAYWQPTIQALISFLGALGFTAATRPRA